MPSQAVLELLVRMKDEASKGLASLGDAVGGLGMVAGGIAAAGVVALGAAVVSGIGDAREAARLYASTEQTILTMGNAAGRSAQEVVDLASSLSDAAGVSLFGDDKVLEASNLLLTFGEIKGETFDLATALTVDLAQALGGAPADQAMMLGKALNDPIRGMSALGKAGLTFSEEQKAAIAAMQESGDMAGAQAIIIAELTKQVGGQAQAAADASGGWSEFQGRLGEAAETVGGALLPIIAALGGFLLDMIIPAVEGVAQAFSDWMADPAVQQGVADLATAIQAGLGMAMAFITDTALPALLSAWAFIRPAIDAILPLFTGDMPAALGQTSAVFVKLGDTVGLIMALISGIIAVALPAIVQFWTDHGAQIMRIVGAAFDYILAVINTVLNLVQGVIKVALALISGDWSQAWEAIKNLSATFVLDIQRTIMAFLDLIASFFDTSLSGILDTWRRNWDNLVSVVQNISWEDVGRFAIDGIRAGLEALFPGLINWVSDKVSSMVDAALDAIGAGSPATKFMPVGQFAIMGIIAGFNNTWPELESALAGLGDKMIDQAQSIAQAAQRALTSAFGATASIDRQMSTNLEKLQGVSSEFLRTYFTQSLETYKKTAEAMADPKAGAQYFKMMSEQLWEIQRIRDQIAEAASEDDRKRLEQQLILISRAHEAELLAFQSAQAGAVAPLAAIAEQIDAMIRSMSGTALTEAQIATVDQLAALYSMLMNASGRAVGGPVERGRPYWVGEDGPELFMPRQSGQIIPAGSSAGALTMHLTFNLPPGTPAQLVDMVIKKIDERTKGRR